MIIYLDTFALLYRSYYAVPNLHSQDDMPTGALYGLTNSLFRIIAELEPDHIIACFDRPEQTLRQEAHDTYKANREMPEEDMIVQIEAARDMLSSYSVHIAEKAGYEADDLLGTLALADAKNGQEVVIVSCDGDLLQLTVHPRIRIFFLRKGMSDFVFLDEADVEKKNGYPARYIVDYKGLAGDSSDNIAGVSGIGATYATRLITAFGDLEGIYAALDAGTVQGAGFSARVEKLLSEGRESAFLSRDLATIHTDVPVRPPHAGAKVWRESVDRHAARSTLEKFSFDSLFARLDAITGHHDNTPPTPSEKHEKELSADEQRIIREASIALWVLDASYTNAGAKDVYAYTGAPSPEAAVRILRDKLREAGRLSVWEDIEKPLMPVIRRMEETGVCFDVSAAQSLSGAYRKKIQKISDAIYTAAGREFNINSPKQLGEVLYIDLKLRPKRSSKTASGGRTTKESVLLDMIDDHSIIRLVLEYRHYEKLRSTYTDALPEFVDKDSRIHTNLQQNGTVTGRLSSRDPNLQNIPIGGEDGTAIRNLFVASNGWTMVSIDYSQMELRIAAILSGDTGLLDIFREGGDVHTSVAAKIFSVTEDAVAPDQRAAAKSINFGILYGMGAQALRRSTNVSLAEAEQFLEEYKGAFPGLFAYFEGIKGEARLSGFVTTAFGRVRHMDGINSSLAFVRAQAERMAVNSVIQGTEADVIKMAMIGTDRMLAEKYSGDVRMVLQIHDELLFEIRPDVINTAVKDIVSVMESVYPDNRDPIPLVTDVKQGGSWGSLS